MGGLPICRTTTHPPRSWGRLRTPPREMAAGLVGAAMGLAVERVVATGVLALKGKETGAEMMDSLGPGAPRPHNG